MRIIARAWTGLVACALALGITSLAQPARAAGEAWLGVYLQEITPELRDGMNYNGPGVLVRRVVDGSPADRAGIERGDVIVQVGSSDVRSAAEVTSAVRGSEPGRRMRIEVVRDGDRKSLDVKLEARDSDAGPGTPETPEPPDMRSNGDDDDTPMPMHMHTHGDDTPAPDVHERHDGSSDDEDEDTPPVPPTPGNGGMRWFGTNGDHGMVMNLQDLAGRGRLGVRIESLTPDLASYFGPRGMKGALVLDVTEGSAAAHAGIRAGDVITRVDSKSIDDADDLIEAVRSSEGDVSIALVRHGSHQTLEAKLAPMSKSLQLRRGPGMLQWKSSDPSDDDAPRVQIDRDRALTDSERAHLRQQLEQLRQEVRDLRRQLRDQSRTPSPDHE